MKPITVLLAIDGSPCSQIAVDLARVIPWPRESVIHLATVVEAALSNALSAFVGAVPPVVEGSAEVIGPVARDLEEIASTLETTGAQIETHVLTGRPGTTIVDAATSLRADLIIVGSRGHGTIGSMMLGSVSAEVADHANCPVLIARKSKWSKVVLGVDGSSFAGRAQQVICDWPIFAGCSVNVVSVAESGLYWTSSLALSGYANSFDYPEVESAIATDHQRWAQRAAQELSSAGRPSTGQAPEGSPATELLRITRGSNADLIVLGTHGRTGMRRLLSGSVARNVSLHAQCSVLVVRETRPLT